MTDTNALAPCPFCGERAETDFIPEHHSYQIECSDSIGCTARITRDSELGAIEAWNCRAAFDAPAQPVAHVSQETFNDDGTSDIIIPALPIGMALYAAPQPAAQALAAWMDIETAPKDKSNVVLLRQPCGSVANGYFLAEAYAGNGAWIWPYIHKNPTHWMPLPAPPAAIAAQKGGAA